MDLQVQKLVDIASLPTRADHGAAGYDLRSVENKIIPAKDRAIVGTGIAIAVPSGTYGRIAPRSGLAANAGLAVGAGVIDESYRGHVKVILFNHGKDDYHVKCGDKIAQLVLEVIVTPDVTEVSELTKTIRGTNGFGSTGK